MRYVSRAACFIALGFTSLAGEAQTSKIETVPSTSIHEAMFVSLNGIQQWITIRGDNARNLVIMMLHRDLAFLPAGNLKEMATRLREAILT